MNHFIWLCTNFSINWTALSVFIAVGVFVWVEFWKMRDRKATAAVAAIVLKRDLEIISAALDPLARKLDPGDVAGGNILSANQPVVERRVISEVLDDLRGLEISGLKNTIAEFSILPAVVAQPAARCILDLARAQRLLAAFLDDSKRVMPPPTKSELTNVRGALYSANICLQMAIEAAPYVDAWMGQLRLKYRRGVRRIMRLQRGS